MRKLRFFRSFLALALLAATWVVSFHSHAKDETGAGARETCVVCVVGHQIKSGAKASLTKAEAPLLLVLGTVLSFEEFPQTVFVRPHSSRAPPLG